jgi:hypothetical protein
VNFAIAFSSPGRAPGRFDGDRGDRGVTAWLGETERRHPSAQA